MDTNSVVGLDLLLGFHDEVNRQAVLDNILPKPAADALIAECFTNTDIEPSK